MCVCTHNKACIIQIELSTARFGRFFVGAEARAFVRNACANTAYMKHLNDCIGKHFATHAHKRAQLHNMRSSADETDGEIVPVESVPREPDSSLCCERVLGTC